MDYCQEEWLLDEKPSPELQEVRTCVEEYLAANRAYLAAQRLAMTDQLKGLGQIIEAVV